MRLKPILLSLLLALALSGEGAAGDLKTRDARANLWVDVSGGKCSRTQRPAAYRDAVACGSLDAAWDACRPGDAIRLRAGRYGAQEISGNKGEPGCVAEGERGVVIGDLVTGGSNFVLRQVVIDVGDTKRAGWRARASNVTLADVAIKGAFVAVDFSGVSNVRWLRGELGSVPAGRRVCGQDAEPVQVLEADHVTIDRVRFLPQDVDPTPNECSANGFHLEMIRLDAGTSHFTLRNSTFVNGDKSGTASVFITEPGGQSDPHDLLFENNFFGTNESVGAFNVHSNVSTCRNYTFAYNTFLASTGAFQCVDVVNVKWIGNLGSHVASACVGEFANNVWQYDRRGSCGKDKWIIGKRFATDLLGLGGADGFRLQPGSPAVDAGEGAGYCFSNLGARDHDGQARPRGARCDAGADERDAGRGAVAASIQATRWGGTAGARTLRLTLALGEPLAVDLQLLRGGELVARRLYPRLRKGRRDVVLRVGAEIPTGPAVLRIALEDRAGNARLVQRAVRVSR